MRKNNENPIIKRIAVKAECSFASPALIGSGLSENTDSDILRDIDDNAFLPGSTVAGVLRETVSDAQILFGEKNISPLWVFDAELTDSNNRPAEVIELDGVEIDKVNKTAIESRKYDFEAIETGSKFTLRFLLTIRHKDCLKDFEDSLETIVSALKSGYVAFGAKTRRGFGAVKCSSAVKREFDLTNGNITSLNEWIDFEWDKGVWDCVDGGIFCDKAESITVKLSLTGSIMIRDTRNIYDDIPDTGITPDYKHISSNGEPVIYGTSWAGAFRSGLYRLLERAYPGKAKGYLDSVFGYVYEKNKAGMEEAEPSKIIFESSFLKKSNARVNGYRSVTRVKIDRFTGGAADSALFTEMPWYGGETTLRIRYTKGRADIRELIQLGLDGLDKGIIQIGGESSVGRGFFKVLEVSGAAKSVSGPKLELKAALEKSVIGGVQE